MNISHLHCLLDIAILWKIFQRGVGGWVLYLDYEDTNTVHVDAMHDTLFPFSAPNILFSIHSLLLRVRIRNEINRSCALMSCRQSRCLWIDGRSSSDLRLFSFDVLQRSLGTCGNFVSADDDFLSSWGSEISVQIFQSATCSLWVEQVDDGDLVSRQHLDISGEGRGGLTKLKLNTIHTI